MASLGGPEALALGRRAWRLTLVGTMVSSLGSGLTLPFLFVYLHGVRDLTLPLAGTIVAVGAVAAFALAPVSGALGDRIGLGRLLLIGLLMQALGTALLAVPSGAPEAFVAVALESGGAAVTYPTLNGLVAHQLPPAERPHAFALRFGVLNAGIGLGGLISGLFVSVQHPATFQVVYLLDAVSTLVVVGIVFFGMRHSPGYRADRPAAAAASAAAGEGASAGSGSGSGDRARRRGYGAVLTDRVFVAFLALNFLLYLFGYAQLNGPWASYATGVVGASPRVVGIGFAANTAVIVVCQLFVSRLTKRWRRSRLLLIAGLIWTAAWGISLLAHLPILHGFGAAVALALSLGVFGLGETLFAPLEGGLPNELAPEDLRSRYNALAFTMSSVAGFVGPPLAGVLLGSRVPASWALVMTLGMGVTALGAIVLGRVLPTAVDRPTVAVASGEPAA
ncbi:hypothetical protein AX769_10080 [Frondihabitans sp. PAMC 28766]|uniref:MFS transporter n=1 Tax=Frondihabitans sp. PAMC 28766 TaxID=1795630 RepID=UPI00078CB850|nr:MFS transporter [Frondihabitans sp. PAMC 28766]AMM20435.1 hypothetical protein AX769_10080 [Frondihabitans sp. PAMC 28766]